MHYHEVLEGLLSICEYGGLGEGSLPERVEFYERHFGTRFPAQYHSFFLECGWFYARRGNAKLRVFGEGPEMDPYLWIEFNNERFAGTEWVHFGDLTYSGRDPEGRYKAIYQDWFAFRRSGALLEPKVWRFRIYSNWIRDDTKDEKIPSEQWLPAYHDFGTWLLAGIAVLREEIPYEVDER